MLKALHAGNLLAFVIRAGFRSSLLRCEGPSDNLLMCWVCVMHAGIQLLVRLQSTAGLV